MTVSVADSSLTLTPALNWNGSSTIMVVVNDGGSDGTDTTSFQLTVNAVNDPPTIELPDSLTFTEDGSLEVDFSDSLSLYIEDVDGDVLELTVIGNEEISVDIEGSMVTFTVDSANWNGEETLMFTVSDGEFADFDRDRKSVV